MLPPSLSKIDIHLLYVFSVVVEAKGFTPAQIALNVSTSTISRQISELETRLGLRLCLRGRKGFRLTEQGETVYQAAQRVFSALGDFRATVDGSRGRLAGHLSIAVVDNWTFNAKALILPALAKFVARAPDVELEISSLAPDDIELAVQSGRIALGFGVFHRHKPGLVYETIGQERIGLYCAASHTLAGQRDADKADALLRSASFARRAYLDEDMVAPVSRGLASNAMAHQIEGIAILILSGKYIGYLPESYADIWLREGRMAHVADGRHDLNSEIKLVRRHGVETNPVVQAFYDLVAEQAVRFLDVTGALPGPAKA